MTACLTKIQEYGFREKNYNRIEALADSRNAACQRALIKAGFQYDGLLREYENNDGNYVDLVMYSRLRSEF